MDKKYAVSSTAGGGLNDYLNPYHRCLMREAGKHVQAIDSCIESKRYDTDTLECLLGASDDYVKSATKNCKYGTAGK